MTIQNKIYSAALAMLRDMPNGKQLAQYMVAQSAHETGNYKSNHFINSNNAFGYSRYAGSKYQIGSGSIADNGQPVAKYATIEDSTKEVAAWILRRKSTFLKVESLEDYALALKKSSYYGDTYTRYLNGLKRFYNSALQVFKKPRFTLLLVAVIGVSFFLLIRKR